LGVDEYPRTHGVDEVVNMVEVEIEIDQLQKAIEGLHRCSARFAQSVPVKETHNGAAAWDDVVHVFHLEGHPTASVIYAWSSPNEGTTDKRRFFAVLHQGPITSPKAAVRAAIVAEHNPIQRMARPSRHPSE
jgi:hypothetical protein